MLIHAYHTPACHTQSAEPRVTSGALPAGIKAADMTVLTGDQDFLALAQGSIQPQKAFMAGKLKIKGNMGLAGKLEMVLKAGGKAKL